MTGKRPFLIGLTGSIGMGKSTTAQMFRDAGVPVWDADTAVHEMYAKGGRAVNAVGEICPDAVQDGAVDREVLKDWIAKDGDALRKLEAVVHPLLADERREFIEKCEDDIAVLDIPLLFEMGNENQVDLIAVVSVDPTTQKKRVMARAGMTEDLFETLLAKQLPDAEKRSRADVVIATDTLENAQNAVAALLHDVRTRLKNA